MCRSSAASSFVDFGLKGVRIRLTNSCSYSYSFETSESMRSLGCSLQDFLAGILREWREPAARMGVLIRVLRSWDRTTCFGRRGVEAESTGYDLDMRVQTWRHPDTIDHRGHCVDRDRGAQDLPRYEIGLEKVACSSGRCGFCLG